ncbi:MAG: 3-hydroxyacyl-CoA dehydrogenase NAD-binding domain-containing protein, partial [Pseudomonadota bacterium]
PNMYERILTHLEETGRPFIAPRLRYISAGGAPLDPDWKARTQAVFGLTLNNGYGITEASPGIAATRPAAPRADVSVGTALPDVTVTVAEPDADGVGELIVKSPGVMKGYYKNAAATRAALPAPGVLRSGDLGCIAADGAITIVGRSKELIVRSGFNVYPPEIEAMMTRDPAVLQAAVVGRPVKGNEEIVAFALAPGARAADIAARLREKLTAYKVPQHIVLVDAFPTAPTGKVLKHKLLSHFADRLPTAPTTETEPMSESPVTIERVGAVGLVCIDNPPVNAASHAVRVGLQEAVRTLCEADDIDTIAIYGAGRTFIAGADIREFGQPPRDPLLTEVCSTLEASEKPVVAVIHGTTLGGGFEVALGCHARVALPGTLVGFPEVTLGILPGAGGTQRAPRLAGMKAALDLITTGKRIPAEEAKDLGLIDSILEGEPRAVALQAAGYAVTGVLPVRKTGELAVEADMAAVEATKAALAEKQPHLFSPQKAADAVAASVTPIAEGLATERALFAECHASPQRAALIHAFFAERAVAKIPEAGATPRKVAAIGVIGGGTMGSGIATAALLSGLTVTMAERDEASAQKGRATVLKNLDGALARGKLGADARADIEAERFSVATDVAVLGSADLVIEAAFEDMAVKKDLFARLDAVAKEGAVLATNTSYLNVNEIAAVTGRPQDVIGLHFFSPAHIMRLLEVVVADKTAPDVVATGFALAKTLRKVAVRAGVCDGFIGNRILSHYKKAAEYLVLDGASPAEVDGALERFGFAMGPFAVSDLAGLDISFMERKRLA